MKKTLSIVLAALMLLCCIPFTASAAISLTRSNVVIIPPTASVDEINYGDSLADITVSGGQLWYVDEEGNKTEVKGTFDIRNKATLKPSATGDYNLPLVFYPEDTETYGEASGSLSYLTMKNKIVSGEWPSIYLRGTYTEIVTPPSFTCDAGVNLVYYNNYTKSGGKVVDANGTDITSSGQFYIDGASSGGVHQYLYEDTYVTARWTGKSNSGYENAYYENVLVKVTRKTASLTTAPSIPAVLIGTTYSEAMEKLTAKVSLVGNTTNTDTASTYWVPTYPDGCTADTPITQEVTFTVSYQNPATDDTFSSEVTVEVYTKPIAEITTAPKAENAKAGMKASELVLTGGVASCDGTFAVDNGEQILNYGSNTVKVRFTPTDTETYDGSSVDINIYLTSIISSYPTITTKGLDAGIKAGELVIEGGEATVPGKFEAVDAEQVLNVGTNSVEFVFVPDDTTVYPQKFTRNLYIQDTYKFLDENGNETIPVWTIPYGTKLYDGNLNVAILVRESGCTFNGDGTKYSHGNADGEKYIIYGSSIGRLLPVGEHTFNIKISPVGYSIYETPPFKATTLQFIVKVLPTEMNVKTVWQIVDQEILRVVLDNEAAQGTLDIYVDGELIAKEAALNKGVAEVTWKHGLTVNKDCTVKVVYNPIENDSLTMEDYEGTFRSKVYLTLTKINSLISINENSSNDPRKCVDGSRIDLRVPYSEQGDFVTWYFLDENGNELDIDVYGIKKVMQEGSYYEEEIIEAKLTDYKVSFNMPNQNVQVGYKTVSMIEEEKKQEAIDNCDCLCHYKNPVAKLIWKIINFFCELFGINQECDCEYVMHY